MFEEQINTRDTNKEVLRYGDTGYIPHGEFLTREASLIKQFQDLTQRMLKTENGREFLRAFARELQ